MTTLTLNSYAKLNLYLKVLNKRKDSYHNISTIFERIDLCDRITLRLRDDKEIRVICDSPDLPADQTMNIAYRSAKLLQDKLGVNKGVDIKISKRIPVGAGLGGGSSNAASVLLGLDKLWRLSLSRKELVGHAKRIGCDVPFFIYNSSFAQGSGRGDKIKPLKNLSKARFWHILVVPRIKVLTARVYAMYDRMPVDSFICLTKGQSVVKILSLAVKRGDLPAMSKILFNSLQRVTTKLHPEIKYIDDKLRNSGFSQVLMSGSGSAVFALAPSKTAAEVFLRRLKLEKSPWRVFIARTI